MFLLRALRIGAVPRLVLVGAGGKTTAMFRLAYQLCGKALSLDVSGQRKKHTREVNTVLVTASTHLAVDQLSLADYHFVVKSARDVSDLENGLPEGVVLLTGEQTSDKRTEGLDEGTLQRTLTLANDLQIPLLVEADGSRRRPVKAPAEHEPPIPPWAETVIVVAGLSALGNPLSEAWVHRPAHFAEVAGIRIGERITPGALSDVLTSREGGLKNIPAGARRVVMLNQADDPNLGAQANQMKDQLLESFHAVLISSLKEPSVGLEATDQGLFTGHSGEVLAVHEPAAGIVLAAGGSNRFGQPKQLLDWHGEALIRVVVKKAIDTGLDPLVVVTGAYGKQVEDVLEGLPLQVVHNPLWMDGQSTSVAAGIRAVGDRPWSAVFLLADQPLISPSVLRALIDMHAQTLSPIVAPLVDGQRANPVLFDREVFSELMELTGDKGGRTLFSHHSVSWLPWHDRGLLMDVDTPQDYRRLLSLGE